MTAEIETELRDSSGFTLVIISVYRTPRFNVRINNNNNYNTNGDKRNAYMIFVGKPEGKRPLGRPRYSWVDNVKYE
jgi:hypothetical protein